MAWLKQRKDDDKRLPLLDFDEQQYYTFDRRWTSFRMVKHSCSYPAPPHKVRMWCSSLGASPDLPSTMDLNTFINTFELITEEKHTLKMAHLTGGETIAFEMVQGQQVSELSTFLLGAQLKQPAIKGASAKKNLKESLTQSVQSLADEFEVGRADLTALAGAASHGARFFEEEQRIASVLKEQAAAAEEERKKLADELIAEEEEEARRREKKKEKKKSKKEKQKEKKKAQAGGSNGGGDDDDDDDDEDEKVGGGGGAVGVGRHGTCTACSETQANGAVVGDANGKGGAKAAAAAKAGGRANGEHGASAKEDSENTKLNGHRPRGAAIAEPSSKPTATAEGVEGGGQRGYNERGKAKAEGSELSGLAKLIELGVASRRADDDSALRDAWPELPEAAAAHLSELQAQVTHSHEVIRALVDLCVRERDAKESAMREAEAARSLAHKFRVS